MGGQGRQGRQMPHAPCPMPNAPCPMPHDGRCLNGGNLRTALPPQCPMPHYPLPNK
ncbi:MAG: hypothetical protein KME31_18480 [Tolypothrix carrinoi HA7290-LM1]|nr:hypothetical protein [Tolypothrix carrinoi HA7290-LM1]